MIKWLKWLFTDNTIDWRDALKQMEMYERGKQDAMRFMVDMLNEHPKISARIHNKTLEVCLHANEYFKQDFDWDTSPRTNIMERHVDRSYH